MGMTRREIKNAWEFAARKAVETFGTPANPSWVRETERLRVLYCSLPMVIEPPMMMRQYRH